MRILSLLPIFKLCVISMQSVKFATEALYRYGFSRARYNVTKIPWSLLSHCYEYLGKSYKLILQRLTRSSYNFVASSFLVSPLLKFIATCSSWTFEIVAGLKWAVMFARTNAFSGLFARLFQNASIKGGLNSRAKKQGTFPEQIVRHKFVCLCLGIFAASGTSWCRKLDDKLGIFKYFPLVFGGSNEDETDESLSCYHR